MQLLHHHSAILSPCLSHWWSGCMCVCESFVKVMQRREERAREKTPWKITQTTARSRWPRDAVFPLMSARQNPVISVIFTPKVMIFITAGNDYNKMLLMINCWDHVAWVCCVLCLKWINRAVSETESQSGNHGCCLQACVASVASDFHPILICFLWLSSLLKGGVVQNRCIIFLIKAWKLAQSYLTCLHLYI